MKQSEGARAEIGQSRYWPPHVAYVVSVNTSTNLPNTTLLDATQVPGNGCLVGW